MSTLWVDWMLGAESGRALLLLSTLSQVWFMNSSSVHVLGTDHQCQWRVLLLSECWYIWRNTVTGRQCRWPLLMPDILCCCCCWMQRAQALQMRVSLKLLHVLFNYHLIHGGPKKLHFSNPVSLEPFKIKWNGFHQNVLEFLGIMVRLQFLCSY